MDSGDRVFRLQENVWGAPVLMEMKNMIQEVNLKVSTYNKLIDMGAGVV